MRIESTVQGYEMYLTLTLTIVIVDAFKLHFWYKQFMQDRNRSYKIWYLESFKGSICIHACSNVKCFKQSEVNQTLSTYMYISNYWRLRLDILKSICTVWVKATSILFVSGEYYVHSYFLFLLLVYHCNFNNSFHSNHRFIT